MVQSGLAPFILYVISQSEIDNTHKDFFFYVHNYYCEKMFWSGQSIL